MPDKYPKGLIAATLANLGERFDFYTMMAILVLFLQAEFGMNGKEAGFIYSTFYFSIYILALAGGIIADKTRNYKGTISMRIVLVAVGHLSLAIPSKTPVDNQTSHLVITCVSLSAIAFGNGLSKGNLQALAGQMYDSLQYASMCDPGFSLFYMFINTGAVLVPFAAVGVHNWWLSTFGHNYDADLPTLCHGHLAGTLSPEATETYHTLVEKASNAPVQDCTAFAPDHLNAFTTSFRYTFGVVIIATIISLTIYLLNKRNSPDPGKKVTTSPAPSATVEMSTQEVKQRVYALFAVFGVVIFFWFSFHQNGLALTYFAKEYADPNLPGMPTFAELFQSLNSFFVVFLTPVIMAIFTSQRRRGKEPSIPKKIVVGMGIAVLAFIIMAVGSYFADLPLYKDIIAVGTSPVRVTPFLLMLTYLTLTMAELHISPLGISSMFKVAPPRYRGTMQGGWLDVTALGNQLLVTGVILYELIPIWMTWTVSVAACTTSMFITIFTLKWLERVVK